MLKKIFLFLFCFSLFSFAKENLSYYPEKNSKAHFILNDSLRQSEIRFYAILYDSLSAERIKSPFTDNRKHIDNEAVVRLQFNGHLTSAFHFDGLIQVANNRTNRDDIAEHFYNPEEGYPYNKQSKNTRTWDIFRLALDYNLGFTRLLSGIDYLQIGPAKRNHVILRGSEYNTRPWQDSSYRLQIPVPTPYFGYQFEVGPLTYTQYAVKLNHDKNLGKYMSAHRLEAQLPGKISLGLSEIVVYGSTVERAGENPNRDGDSTGRTFEWGYVLPFIPYVFEEHYFGDKDNNALAFDISIQTLPSLEIYAEMIWDDMKSPTKIFDDSWWGNKWAASLGFEKKLQFKNLFLSWVTEYTRIEPWVYTHHKGAGYTYSNYGESLGSDLGPNAQEFYTSLEGRWKILAMKIHASQVAKDTAFGSHLFDIHTPESPTDKKFLNKKSTYRYRELGAEISLFPTEFLFVRAFGARFFGDFSGYRTEFSAGLSW